MGKTKVGIKGRMFYINGVPTYSDIPGSNPKSHGLIWNSRVIQGIFDDNEGLEHLKKVSGADFDPEKNTDDLIASLPEWYAYGLRAITVGLQGGWAVDQFEISEVDNNAFTPDGLSIRPDYAKRLDRLIRAADEVGMLVIVNYLYWAQANRFKDGIAVRNSVLTASRFLRDNGYTNVLVDLANEYNIHLFKHPIINTEEGQAALIDLAKREAGGIYIGSSSVGLRGVHSYMAISAEVAEVSDFILIHVNGQTRTDAYKNMRNPCPAITIDKPVVCNEANPCFTRVDAALEAGASWGYYNNYTKQIIPARYGVLNGEDLFFARRIARAVGIPVKPLSEEEAFGFDMHVVRVACEYPEYVERVEYFLNGERIDIVYDEPFFLYAHSNWLAGTQKLTPGDTYKANVYLKDGKVVERIKTV